jgi:hypothetical protein
MTTSKDKYPEHEKLHKVADKSQACGEFLEWVTSKYTLGEYHEHTNDCNNEEGDRMCGTLDKILYPSHVPVRKLLADFFEIDEDKLETEKLKMLDDLRSTEEEQPPRSDNQNSGELCPTCGYAKGDQPCGDDFHE